VCTVNLHDVFQKVLNKVAHDNVIANKGFVQRKQNSLHNDETTEYHLPALALQFSALPLLLLSNGPLLYF